MLAPIAGKIFVSRFDMINPRVQQHGDVALLTFNLISYQQQPDGIERAVARWNSTEAYARAWQRWGTVGDYATDWLANHRPRPTNHSGTTHATIASRDCR